MTTEQEQQTQPTKTPYRVLLYYKFVHIENPEVITKQHLRFSQRLGVKGRVIIAHEGINGTVSGTIEQTEIYKQEMRKNPLFADIWFKEDEIEGHVFKGLHVRWKPEIVTFRSEYDLRPAERSGERLSPKQFFEELQREDTIVLDGRTDYEYDLGHFRGAIRPDTRSFKEFPDWIRENRHLFDGKRVLTYCTGGIRCEKLTAFMLEEGISNVAQLDGGIVTYGKDPDVRGRLWDGKCYVFDERISVPINQEEEVVVSRCSHCGTPTDTYVNCANIDCHKQHFQCSDCVEKTARSCSSECQQAPRHEILGLHSEHA